MLLSSVLVAFAGKGLTDLNAPQSLWVEQCVSVTASNSRLHEGYMLTLSDVSLQFKCNGGLRDLSPVPIV
jgi:hypothetical protein